MAGEVFAGLSALKTAFDMAQGLQKIHDAVARDRAVIELQKEILTAQSAQAALIEEAGALKKRVAELDAWGAEKERYKLKEVGAGVFAYVPKEGMDGGEPVHRLCANCYQRGQKSILQATHEMRKGWRVHYCPHCKSEFDFPN
jgi:hypothetical protein